ncbi:MAG: hypothetical protein A4E47_00196 [Methanosaeta sp. PtaU1.Bin028]|nr:MAG: hypothetical protein A4E47_00196 [Methanosaeta sp. PtaU1.Bin028]
MAPLIFSGRSPALLRTFTERRMSVSTEYPTSIRRAAIVPNESLTPTRVMKAAAAIISAMAQNTTMAETTGWRNITRTTMAISRKDSRRNLGASA